MLIPDLPGFGESSKPADASYTIAEQVDRVRAFVRAQGIERVHLGGSSMGGFIATQYAATYPTEVGSIWLLGPAGTRVAIEQSEMWQIIASTGSTPLIAERPEDFARTMEFVMNRPPFLPHSMVQVLGEQAAKNSALNKHIFRQIGAPVSPYLEDRMPGMTTPALVVWGEQDRVLSVKAAETYRTLMSSAQVIVLPEIGHLPMLEAPARVAADYLAFLDHVATGSAKPAPTTQAQ